MNGLTSTVANLYNTLEPDIKVSARVGKYFSPDEIISKLKSIEGIQGISKSINDKALIKNSAEQVLVSVKGVDDNFSEVTNAKSCIIEGIYGLNEKNNSNIVLGKGIAEQMQVNLHSFVNDLSLLSPARGKMKTFNAEVNMEQVYVNPTGIFSLNDEFDYQFVFVNLKTAESLFDTQGKVSGLEIRCEQGKEDDVKENIQNVLGENFTVKSRYELNDVLFKSLETEKLATFIILAFVLVIATFNIIGALTMLIIEKKKDIKTLYSLGAAQQTIRNIFMREGFLISGVGASIGLCLGLFVCWLQIRFHLVKFGNEFVLPYYPIELQWKDFVWIFFLIMFIGFLSALYPVRVFTKTDMVR